MQIHICIYIHIHIHIYIYIYIYIYIHIHVHIYTYTEILRSLFSFRKTPCFSRNFEYKGVHFSQNGYIYIYMYMYIYYMYIYIYLLFNNIYCIYIFIDR